VHCYKVVYYILYYTMFLLQMQQTFFAKYSKLVFAHVKRKRQKYSILYSKEIAGHYMLCFDKKEKKQRDIT
jgi:hypothetical protein